jgi:antitoxin ParD1/3/4
MSNININLTPYLKQYVESKVKGGRYNNVSEVVREALRLLEEQDLLRAAKLRDLRAAIEEGDHSPAEPLEDDETLLRQAKAYHAAKSMTPTQG